MHACSPIRYIRMDGVLSLVIMSAHATASYAVIGSAVSIFFESKYMAIGTCALLCVLIYFRSSALHAFGVVASWAEILRIVVLIGCVLFDVAGLHRTSGADGRIGTNGSVLDTTTAVLQVASRGSLGLGGFETSASLFSSDELGQMIPSSICALMIVLVCTIGVYGASVSRLGGRDAVAALGNKAGNIVSILFAAEMKALFHTGVPAPLLLAMDIISFTSILNGGIAAFAYGCDIVEDMIRMDMILRFNKPIRSRPNRRASAFIVLSFVFAAFLSDDSIRLACIILTFNYAFLGVVSLVYSAQRRMFFHIGAFVFYVLMMCAIIASDVALDGMDEALMRSLGTTVFLCIFFASFGKSKTE